MNIIDVSSLAELYIDSLRPSTFMHIPAHKTSEVPYTYFLYFSVPPDSHSLEVKIILNTLSTPALVSSVAEYFLKKLRSEE